MQCGESDPLEFTIKINSKLSDQVILNTLIHEISHQILALSGLSKLLDEKMEEAICEAIGTGISNVILTNNISVSMQIDE